MAALTDFLKESLKTSPALGVAARWLARHRRDEPLPARPAVVAAACLAAGCGLIRFVESWSGASLAVACWTAALAALLAWVVASWLDRPRVALVTLCAAIAACGAAWAEARFDLFRRDDFAWQLSEAPSPVAIRGTIEQAFRDYQNTGFGGWPWDRTDPVHGGDAARFARHAGGRIERPGLDPVLADGDVR